MEIDEIAQESNIESDGESFASKKKEEEKKKTLKKAELPKEKPDLWRKVNIVNKFRALLTYFIIW